VPGGLDLPQMQEIARRLTATGQVDYLNVIAGNNLERSARIRHWPRTPAPHGLFSALAGGIKRVVDVPVCCVGRVTDPALAEEILARGDADLLGKTRAQIADPHPVRKVLEGRIDQNLRGLAIRCIVNPELGQEAAWSTLSPAEQSRHVVVVGEG
jgi:2,4-dienoyl-CoA reductase-like NADH-dependent reductase (Old Yellow Enzyme family)